MCFSIKGLGIFYIKHLLCNISVEDLAVPLITNDDTHDS